MSIDNNRDIIKNTRVFRLLSLLYPIVSPLGEYLKVIIKDSKCRHNLQQQHDTLRYTKLLRTLLVCSQKNPAPIEFTSYAHFQHQDELIANVVQRMQRSALPGNLLTYGFGAASENIDSQVSKSQHVECTYPSHTCGVLMSRPWKTLLSRVGDEVMMYLLEAKSLFELARPSCYIQLTGTPVYELDTRQCPPLPPTSHPAAKALYLLLRQKHCHRKKKQIWRKKRKQIAITQLVKSGTYLEIKDMPGKNRSMKPIKTGRKLNRVRTTKHMANPDCVSKQNMQLMGKAIVLSEFPDKTNRQQGKSWSANEPNRKEGDVDIESDSTVMTKDDSKRTGSHSLKRSASDIVSGLPPKRPCLKTIVTEQQSGQSKWAQHGQAQKKKTARKESDSRYKADIRKQSVLHASCLREGLVEKHFLKRMTTDDKSIAQLMNKMFSLSVPTTDNWPRKCSFKDHGMQEECQLEEMSNVGIGKKEGTEASVESSFTALNSKDIPQSDSKQTYFRNNLNTGNALRKSVMKQFFWFKTERSPIISSDPQQVPPDIQVSEDILYKLAPKLADTLRTIVKLNRRTNYKAILDYYCPLDHVALAPLEITSGRSGKKARPVMSVPHLTAPVFTRRPKGRSSSLQQSSQGLSHPVLTSETRAGHISRAESVQIEHKRTMSKLLNSHYEFSKVYCWLRAMCRRTLPTEVWGTPANQRQFFRCLYSFMKAGKFEKLSAQELIHRMKVEKIPFLADFASHLDRERALLHFLRWLLVSYCTSLLKAYFYVTASSVFRNRLFYYRKPSWAAVEKQALQDAVESGHLQPLSEVALRGLLQRGALPASTLRFVPTTSGVRPIVALSTRSQKHPEGGSVNRRLESLFHLLTHIKKARPELVGSSVLGHTEVHAAWRRLADYRRVHDDIRRLYFVKMDIARCFDSMDQQRLMDILSEHMKPDAEYVVRRYVKLVSAGGRLKRTYCRQVVRLDHFVPDPLQFAVSLQQGATPVHDAVIVDQVHHKMEDAESLLRLLEAHVTMNTVTVGGRAYLQARGVSQGSVLSPLLCAFYYGRMESQLLPAPRPEELLLRQVDDFLLVTPHLHRATAFLATMLTGLPDYNCHVSVEKTLVNFPAPCHPQVAQLAPTELFPWCGLLLDTQTLAVSADYSRYATLRGSDILTFDTSHIPGTSIFTKLARCLKLQCSALLVDSAFCGRRAVVTNLYQMALLTAARLVTCERALPDKCNACHHQAFFTETVLKLAAVLCNVYRFKLKRVSSLSALTDCHVTWVFLSAVVTTLGARRSRYRRLEAAILRHQRHVAKMTDDVRWLQVVVDTVPPLYLQGSPSATRRDQRVA